MDSKMAASVGERFLWTVYIADRNKTTFEFTGDVPNYVQQMVPIFISLIILEDIVNYVKTGKLLRLNDGITSLSHGMIMLVTKLATNGIELVGYEWLYSNRFIDLDWQSAWTWWAAAIGVDFGYYWIHRAVHEISLFWCSHQVHHSSEEYNLFTALRQSAFQHLCSIGFYQPLALLGVPLPALLVHLQLNLIYQFWIHTEIVSNIGPLEFILNTPSHHRVHHGVNKWCLDKNYAGFLIIWDRMFGTFEPERKDEKLVYGLVSQPQTFEPFYLQLFYYKQVFEKSFAMKTWGESFKALFYGPGWSPGSPRLGNENDLPDKPPIRKKYHENISVWVQLYLLFHFVIVLYVQQITVTNYASFNWFSVLTYFFFMFFSLFIIGSFFDKKWWAPILEFLRCTVTATILGRNSFTDSLLVNSIITWYFAVSAVIWGLQSLDVFRISRKKSE